MKKLLTIAAAVVTITACSAHQNRNLPPQQELLIKVESVMDSKVEVDPDQIVKGMEVPNTNGNLQLSFISEKNKKAFVAIYAGLSVSDVKRFWNDMIWIENNTKIRDVELFINSPGGDAFAGLALSDQIARARARGFTIVAHASGIIASAAVPVFAACNVRKAAAGTIFMVHEAALWKWPGRETASDIRSQNELMTLLQGRYLKKLADNSKLSLDEWKALEKETTWFSADKALEWGLVDSIE